jgi:hypothetical protein
MSKRFALAALLAGLGAAGCTSTSAEKQYQADQPPPLARGERAGPTELDPVRLPAAQTRVSAEDIDETNYQDAFRKLQSERNVEHRALTQAKAR